MIHLFDSYENIIGVLVNPSKDKGYTESKITEDADTTLLKIDFRTINTVDFTNVSKISAQDQDGMHRLFAFGTVLDKHDENGFYQQVTYNGEHVLLGKAKPIAPFNRTDVTLSEMVKFALNGTDYQVGQVDFAGVEDVVSTEYMTPLAVLQLLKSTYNCVLRFRIEFEGNKIVRFVDFLLPSDAFSGKRLVFGKDILDIERNRDEQNTISRLVGQAFDSDGNVITFEDINSGLNYVEDAESYTRWNNHGDPFYSIYDYQPDDGGDIDKQKMLIATKKELTNRLNNNFSYTITPAVIEKIPGLEHEKIRIGMTLHIKDDFFNPALLLSAQVQHTEMPELDDLSTDFSFQFGNYKPIKSKLNQQVRNLNKQLVTKSTSWDSALPTAQLAQNRLNNLTFFAEDFGIFGDGTTDHTQLIIDTLTTINNNGGGNLLFGKGTHIITDSIDIRTFVNVGIFGLGVGLTKFVFQGPVTGKSGFNLQKSQYMKMAHFTLDMQASLAERDHGIAFGGSSNLHIHHINVIDWTGSAIISVSTTDGSQNANIKVHDIEADGKSHGRNGVNLATAYNSGMERISVKNLDRNNTPGYAVQLKNNCTRCWIRNVEAENVVAVVALGHTTDPGVNKCVISDVRGINCDYGIIAGHANGNSFDNINIDECAIAYVHLNECSYNVLGNVAIQHMTEASRAIILDGDSQYNVVKIESIHNTVTIDKLVTLSDDTRRNSLYINRLDMVVSNEEATYAEGAGTENIFVMLQLAFASHTLT